MRWRRRRRRDVWSICGKREGGGRGKEKDHSQTPTHAHMHHQGPPAAETSSPLGSCLGLVWVLTNASQPGPGPGNMRTKAKEVKGQARAKEHGHTRAPKDEGSQGRGQRRQRHNDSRVAKGHQVENQKPGTMLEKVQACKADRRFRQGPVRKSCQCGEASVPGLFH